MVWTQLRHGWQASHGKPLRLRGRPISLQNVMGTIMLGTRFSDSLRSCWVLYLWVYGLPFLHDGGNSYSARGDAMLCFHRDGLPQATFRDEVLGLRFSGGTSMETTVQFFPWEQRVAAMVSMLKFGQDVPGLRRPRCHRGTTPQQRSTTPWTVTAVQVTTALKSLLRSTEYKLSRSSRQLFSCQFRTAGIATAVRVTATTFPWLLRAFWIATAALSSRQM